MGAPTAADALRYDARGRLLVNAQLGENALVFRLDSAASHSIVYETAGWLLALTPSEGGRKRVVTATGARWVPVYEGLPLTALCHSLDLAEILTLPDPDDGAAVGLIGVDFLRGKTVLMNKITETLTLHDDGGSATALGLSPIQGRPVGYRSLAIRLRINGLDIDAIVDTGASHSILNGVALKEIRRLQPENTPLVTGGPVRSVSAGGGRVGARAGRLDHLIIGPRQYRKILVTFADLPVFRTFGATTAPAMILGMDILGKSSFALDLKRYRLFLPSDGQPEGSVP